jgi:hypothetical protein
MSSRTSSLTVSLIDEVSRPARAVAEALEQAELRVKEISAAMGEDSAVSDKFVSSLSRLKLSAADIEAISRAFQDYTRVAGVAGTATSDLTKEQIAGIRQWENATLSSVRTVMQERRNEATAMRNLAREQNQQLQSDIAEQVRIVQQGAIEQARIQRTAAEEAITAQRQAAREQAAVVQKGVDEQNRIQEEARAQTAAMAKSLGTMIVGADALEAVKKSVTAGATLQTEGAKLNAAGVTDADATRASEAYAEFAKTHAGALQSNFLGTFGQARTIVGVHGGDINEALEMATLGERYRTALANSGLSTSDHDIENVMKMMDEMGLKTHEQRETFLNEFTRTQQAFKGQINTDTALSSQRNARQSIYGWSPDFVNNALPTYLQTLGENAGTSIMTAYQNYIGHHMQKTEIEALEEQGFLRSEDIVRDHGRTTIRDGAHAMFESELKSNPFQWALDMHSHFLEKKGNTEDKWDDFVAKMPRAMASIMEFAVKNESRIRRDAETRAEAHGLSQETNEHLGQNPLAAFDALRQSVEQFGASVTSPMMSKIGPALTSMAQGLTSISTWYEKFAKNHPTDAGLIGTAATGIVGGGGLALLWKSFGGGFGLKGSAKALDASAEELTAAARMLRGEAGAGGHGPGRSPSTPSLTGRIAVGGSTAVGALSLAPSTEAEITEALNDNSKSVVGQAWQASADALKAVAADIGSAIRNAIGPAPEIKRLSPAKQDLIDRLNPAFEIKRNGIGSDAVVAPPPKNAPKFVDASDMDAANAPQHPGGSGPHPVVGKPQVDTYEIEDAIHKAHMVQTTLSATSRPDVDTSSIERAVDMASHLQLLLRNIAQMDFTGGLTPSLGSAMRGQFSSSGILGE